MIRINLGDLLAKDRSQFIAFLDLGYSEVALAAPLGQVKIAGEMFDPGDFEANGSIATSPAHRFAFKHFKVGFRADTRPPDAIFSSGLQPNYSLSQADLDTHWPDEHVDVRETMLARGMYQSSPLSPPPWWKQYSFPLNTTADGLSDARAGGSIGREEQAVPWVLLPGSRHGPTEP
jgi:hypothetical protein